MAENYYTDIISQIKEMIEQKKWSEALFLVKTELNAPYVPSDIESQLLDLQKQILVAASDEIGSSKAFNEDVFENDLFSSDKATRVSTLTQIEKINANKFCEVFEKFLISDLPNDEKTLLILQLQNQNINHDFKVKKNDNEMMLNPGNFNLDQFMTIFKEANFIYYKIAGEKNVTEQNYFNDLLMIFINEFIPFKIRYEAWELTIGVLKVVRELMNEQFDENEYIVEYELDDAKVVEVIKRTRELANMNWG